MARKSVLLNFCPWKINDVVYINAHGYGPNNPCIIQAVYVDPHADANDSERGLVADVEKVRTEGLYGGIRPHWRDTVLTAKLRRWKSPEELEAEMIAAEAAAAEAAAKEAAKSPEQREAERLQQEAERLAKSGYQQGSELHSAEWLGHDSRDDVNGPASDASPRASSAPTEKTQKKQPMEPSSKPPTSFFPPVVVASPPVWGSHQRKPALERRTALDEKQAAMTERDDMHMQSAVRAYDDLARHATEFDRLARAAADDAAALRRRRQRARACRPRRPVSRARALVAAAGAEARPRSLVTADDAMAKADATEAAEAADAAAVAAAAVVELPAAVVALAATGGAPLSRKRAVSVLRAAKEAAAIAANMQQLQAVKAERKAVKEQIRRGTETDELAHAEFLAARAQEERERQRADAASAAAASKKEARLVKALRLSRRKREHPPILPDLPAPPGFTVPYRLRTAAITSRAVADLNKPLTRGTIERGLASSLGGLGEMEPPPAQIESRCRR